MKRCDIVPESRRGNNVLTDREEAFIGARDSFYMATVSETGWPYVQHRGGPGGFVRVIDQKTLGFPDLSGNRQFVSTGNLQVDDRVSLFFMDYPNKARLKLLGRVKTSKAPEILESLALEGCSAKIERAFLIDVAAVTAAVESIATATGSTGSFTALGSMFILCILAATE